jgi:hypothetical protein
MKEVIVRSTANPITATIMVSQSSKAKGDRI